jgi:hypothetical protein
MAKSAEEEQILVLTAQLEMTQKKLSEMSKPKKAKDKKDNKGNKKKGNKDSRTPKRATRTEPIPTRRSVLNGVPSMSVTS